MINFTTCANVANSFSKVLQGYTKGIRLIALLTMLCTIGVGQMWGAEYTIAFLTATNDGSTEITSSTKTSTVLESSSCDYVKAFTSNCAKAYYKGKSGVKLSSSKASGTLEFNLADLCKVNVSKIVINTAQYSSETSSVAFYAGTTSLGSVSSGNTFTYDFNSPQEVTSIKITSTKRSYVSKIIITTYEGTGGSDPDEPETPEKTATSLTWSAATYTATVGETNTFPTLTTTPADLTGVTYTSSNTSVATINASNGAITLVAAGSTTITASYAGNETYEAATDASYTLTVNAAQGGGDPETPGTGESTETATLTFDDTSKRTSFSTSKQVWTENGVTLTNDKSSSTSNVADYYKPARFYKNSKLTITHTSNKIVQIVFDCASSSYATALQTATGNTATISSDKVTVTFSPAVESYIITALSAGQVQMDALTVTYQVSSGGETPDPETPATDLTDAQFAWSAATAEATMGASNTFPTLTNTLPVSVTYESSTPATATIDATSGAITLVAPGTTTISAKFAGGEVSGTTYAPKTVTYALTVLKAPATPTSTVYVKVTSTAGITDGEYLIVYEDAEGNPKAPVAFDGSLAPVKLDVASNNIEVSIASNTIAGNTDIDAATFTINTTAGTIQTKDGYYIGQTSNANGLATSTTTEYTNTISIENDGSATIISGGAYLRYNSANDNLRFRYFKSSTYTAQKAIALYKKASSHTLTYGTCINGSVSADVANGATVLSGTTITLSNTPATNYKLSAYDVYKTGDATAKVTVTDGKFVMPEFNVTISATFVPVKTLTSIEITTAATQTTFWQGETFNHTGLVVTAHFDGAEDEDVTDKVTVEGSTATAGAAVEVTVSYTEGTTTKTATYTITVKAIPNTKETAYSVADAYDIIDKLTTAEGVFISGIISQVDSYNSTYKSITYWISADGTTTKQLEVYSGKGLESADFTAVTDLSVGDQVIVCGNLKLYNEIYEFDKNNYLAAYTPTTKDPAGLAYATTEYTVNLGDSFATPVLSNPNSLTVTYSTSDASKATVDATTGAVTIVAAGTVTITASTTGDATHDAGTASYTITIIDPYENIARLPFTYNSGKADIEATAGITHSGLGSDYSDAPYLKFDGTDDHVIIRFDVEPGILSYDIKGNSFSGGTFTVQESGNGETYTDIVAYTELGGKENKTHTLASTSRYVKFIYTEKSSGNVALGNISIQKPDLRADAGLAWNPETVTLTKGDAFTAPTLSNPNSVSGITYESSNTDVAIVTDAGVIALAGSTGEATITATFAGDATYKRATATCTIIVNAIPALDAPTGLTVTDLTCSSVTLSWNAVDGASSYEVDRILSGHRTTYETKDLTITINDLTGGLENAWKVRAIGDGIKHSNSEDANGDNFTTLFSVKYYVDEEIWHGCDNGCAANDGSYEICETVPTKANYDFAGWATSAGGEVTYQAGGTINDIAANVTLHAVWTLKKYTVTWIADDTETTVQFDHGADLTLPDAPTPCDGMEFVGWTTQRAYIHSTDPLFTEATGTVTSDATYYAVFATQGTSTGETTLDFSAQRYENATKVTSLEKNGITVSFAKGEATTDATYYNTGTAVRVYAKGKFTVSAAESSISQIVLTFGEGDKSNAITSNIGTYTNGTWTGEANSVTFTVGGDTDYRRIKSITVTSGGGASTFTGHTTTCSGTTTLDAPQNLAVSNIKYNSATFTWDEVEGARSYSITIGDMTPITTTTNTYTTNPLKAGTAYTWSVQALGNNTNVLHSSVTTGPEFRTGASVTITWVTGGESTTTTTTAGLPLGTLKTTTPPDDCSTKIFIGWTTTRNIDSTGEGITYITEETVPTKNTTYYAVFAEPQDNGGALGRQLFYESFNSVDGKTGGTDGQWSGSIASVQLTEFGDWTLSFAYKAKECIKLGKVSDGQGSATTPALGIDGTATLSFNAGAWNIDSEATGINLIIVGEGTIIPSSITLNKGQFDTYTATINGANADTKVQFVAQNASNNRFFLDEVYVHEGSTITYSDYSTSCGTYFVTFYGFTGYSTTCNGNPAEVEVKQGGNYTIPTCTPTEDPQGLGRTFAGTWNTKANGKGTPYEPGQEITQIEDHITLYAQWALNTESNITLPTDVDDLANTDIVVNGGNTLTLQAGTTTINSLTLKGGIQSDGEYKMPIINIPAGATLVRNSNKINLDLKVNNQSYYPFAVPFEVANTAANVNYINPTLKDYANKNDGYGKYYRILEYNGAGRADNGVHKDNWVHVGRTDVKLIPGKGYAISAVPASGQDTVTIRITMNVDNAWLANGEQTTVNKVTRNEIAVSAHTGAAANQHKRHAGWNFVANPYLANFSANENISGAGYLNGKLLIENGNYSYTTDEVPYVTIPTYNFAHYYQQKLSEATLSPAYGFFVQVGTDGTMTFETAGRQQAPASIAARNAEERPVKMDVDITLSDNHSSDQTGIIISDRYSDAYEIGRDLEKLFGSAYNLSVYTLMADNTPLAFQALAIRSNMQVIPVGYRAPEQGEYTFRLNEATSSIDLLNEQYEQLVLVDYQTGELTNLLIADYTFYSERTQADNRFAIYAVPRQNAPTDLPNAIGQDKQAQKIIHNGHLYILRDGNVYNGNGQIVK